jgi:hypothetical protein
MKDQNPILNPHKIFWGIVVIENGLLNNQMVAAITKIAGSKAHPNYCFFHGAGERFLERCQNVLNNLAVHDVSGKIYVITDKQYGMIANSWNGSEPERAKPFTHQVTIREGKMICVVPLSQYQVENAQSF